MPVSDPFGLVGTIIDGQLRVEEVVGEGGFSIVYKGEHVGLGEPVAIKCLKLPRKLDPKLADAFGKRFRDEGRLLYRLSQGSLYIVRSITSGTCIAPATGVLVPYMALEWLHGHSLVQEFRDRRARGRMPVELHDAVKLFDPAVQALAYAHMQGVVHRDIKPGNLFYTQTREGPKLKVLDFGLAKIFNDEAIGMQPSVKTAGNFFMCSPSYGAPEQFDPRVGEVGPWTDVYALALVFVEALADKKARHADSMAEGAMLALNPATRPTPQALGVAVSDEVEGVIARAVALKPQDRPPDAGAFWGELKNAVSKTPPPKRPGSDFAQTILDPPRGDLAQTLGEDEALVAMRAQIAEAIARAEGDKPPQTVPMARLAPPLGQTVRMDDPVWLAARAQMVQIAQGSTPPPAAGATTMPLVNAPPARTTAPPVDRPTPAPMTGMQPFEEAAAAPRKRSAWPIVVVVLVVVALMGAAAYGGYVMLKRRGEVHTVGRVERGCPSSLT